MWLGADATARQSAAASQFPRYSVVVGANLARLPVAAAVWNDPRQDECVTGRLLAIGGVGTTADRVTISYRSPRGEGRPPIHLTVREPSSRIRRNRSVGARCDAKFLSSVSKQAGARSQISTAVEIGKKKYPYEHLV